MGARMLASDNYDYAILAERNPICGKCRTAEPLPPLANRVWRERIPHGYKLKSMASFMAVIRPASTAGLIKLFMALRRMVRHRPENLVGFIPAE